MRFEHVLEARLTSIKVATPLTLDEAVILPYRLQALVLVEQLRVALDAIKQFDKEIERVATRHVDYALFSALPGAGPSLAPRLLVAFGEQRERYHNAADLQQYAGVAPVTQRSGKTCWVHWRWQCPTFLRQTFVEGRQLKPSTNPSGPVHIIGNSVPKDVPIRRLCVPWRLSGSVFSIVAGRRAPLMMSQNI